MNEIRFIDLFAGVGGFHKGLEQATEGFGNSKPFGKACGQRGSFVNASLQENQQCSPHNRGFHKGLEQANNNITPQRKRETRFSKKSKKMLNHRQYTPFRCIWASEWDKHATEIYKNCFPETPLETKDIRLVKANSIPKADLLCAGFPCQAFSLAGKRKGFEEARGTLFYEICRIAKAKRIPYLLLENVKGLLSAQEGDAFRIVLDSLDELGYCLQWQVLNSKDFGVPQNRERVFIVGCLGEKRFQQVFPIRQDDKIPNGQDPSQGSYFKSPLRSQGDKLMIELTEGVDQSKRVYSPEGISKTIAGNAGGTGAKTGLYALNPRNFEGKSYVEGSQAIALSQPSGNNQSLVYDAYNRGWRKGEGTKALRTNEGCSTAGNLIGGIRRLTPIECERLQGFPDNWTEGLSDTQRYKCMGNAVTVNVVEAIGRRMLEAGLFG